MRCSGAEILPTCSSAKRNIAGRWSDQRNVSINGLSVAQQRAALRRLVVAFGELNTIVDLAADAGSPDLRAHAESARDLLGELVTDIARPGGDRNCQAPDRSGERVDRSLPGSTGTRGAWLGSTGKLCGATSFDSTVRRWGWRTESRSL